MTDIVGKLWGFCHTLRHDGIDYGDYIEQLTYLLFLKMIEEKGAKIPREYAWTVLREKSGVDLTDHYMATLRGLGKQQRMLGDIYAGAMSRFSNPVNLKRLVNLIDEIEWTTLNIDVKAAAYEGLLEKSASEGMRIWNNVKRMLLTSEEIDKYSLKPGDILINRVNSRELVGKAAIIEEIKKPVVFESKNIRLRLIEKNTLPRFINYCFMTRMVKDVFEGNAKQTVGMATISQPQISSLKFAVPPLSEQEEIIRCVETLFRIADSVEKQVTYATVRAEKLTQAILAKAFRGELVPTEAELARREGRVYEPASTLLARIKAKDQGLRNT